MGRTATGTPTLAQIVGDEVVRCVLEWLGLHAGAEVSCTTPSTFTMSWPESLAPETFHGLAGELVRVIEPTTEADPAALLIQFLVAFGNIIGRGPHFIVERHPHYTNLFAVIVGATAKARKGTSWARIADLFCGVDPLWLANRIHGGVGSGEGVIWAVRDPIFKGEKLLDEGIADKRLLLLETEFAQPLAIAAREGSTVSETLRRAWDEIPLQTLTKNNPARATGAHVSMIGHVTSEELLRHLGSTEVANGFANRFLFVCARRSRLLAVDAAMVAALRAKGCSWGEIKAEMGLSTGTAQRALSGLPKTV